MSFGYRDKDWIDPIEEVVYSGDCLSCEKFIPCPCGCGYGCCSLDEGHEIFDGKSSGCEEGFPADWHVVEPEPDYDAWRDMQLEKAFEWKEFYGNCSAN